MTTAVSICSNALLRLGADPINSFDEADTFGDNIDRTRLVANLWPTIRRQVLRSHPWNCAIRRVLLSPDVAPPGFGWTHRFQRPADWLRTVAVGDYGREGDDFISEGGYFLAHETPLSLTYVFDNDNPATWDAALVGAMETAMSAALAYPVTKSTSLAEALSAELRSTLASARALDAQDDPPQVLGDFPLYGSRYGSWGRFR